MSAAKSGGIGICGILFIVFVVLKLTNVIAWSWWLVFSPLWIPIVLTGLILAGAFAFMTFAFIGGAIANSKSLKENNGK